MSKRVAILGLGLIGGSMALGLRESDWTVVGFDQDPASLETGKSMGVIDESATTVGAAVEGADLVVIAVPVMATADILRALPETFDAVLTDVASVKQPILDAFAAVFGKVPDHFVAGHPIAGSEQHGVSAARVDLFRQHRVLLTPGETTDSEALRHVQELWQSLGAEVSTMSVDHHDRMLGQTSHLPHLLAFSLIDTLSSQGNSLEIFDYAAGGLRDFSRIAASDPTMWGDIFLSNREALLQILDDFSSDLEELRQSIEAGDRGDLLTRLARSKAARDHFSQILLQRSQPPEEK